MALHRAQERAQIARLVISLVRVIYRSRFGKTGSMVGQIETLLVSGAVLLGEVDERLRSASEISRILGIPRPTVIRKLNELLKRGIVQKEGRHYRMNDRNIAQKDAYIDECITLILNAKMELNRNTTGRI